MNDLSHPADPGFRVILALMRAREIHRRVAGCLPDWPPSIKDAHEAEWRALSEAWTGMWDVFCAEPEGADAAADGHIKSDIPTVSVPAGIPCVAEIVWDEAEAAVRSDGETHCETHQCVIPDAEQRDEPPARRE